MLYLKNEKMVEYRIPYTTQSANKLVLLHCCPATKCFLKAMHWTLAVWIDRSSFRRLFSISKCNERQRSPVGSRTLYHLLRLLPINTDNRLPESGSPPPPSESSPRYFSTSRFRPNYRFSSRNSSIFPSSCAASVTAAFADGTSNRRSVPEECRRFCRWTIHWHRWNDRPFPTANLLNIIALSDRYR